MLECWWNVAMDQQAFARVWRIGQTSETEFVRLSAKDTIDEKVIGTQETKAEAISKAMKDKDGLR
jgi:SNF2 family DNA or RNA helicase